ncbi:hypothetical protein SM124_07325 [Bacillus sp. 31A1R]|uniref:Uncharacterized protein n=1 Tax=Robertmurraya mangrovi TaxID=3098077 RepID=A0ABU5IWR6_9BACI|nr:hypothetical protein [Bacillus sp. 31A1R]MDZ5471556.1 hypothetical protein [Bacillus sp. 31A1R]
MNYLGTYPLPDTLKKLFYLEEELQQEGFSLDSELSLILMEEYEAYNVTPYDVIPFARTGVDGIHFGFLTDFGRVKDLEEANIVCVSPMNFGNFVKIVARNLKEFIDVVFTLKGAIAIENFLSFSTKDEYESLVEQIKQELSENEDFNKRNTYVLEHIKVMYECKKIDDLYLYQKELEYERLSKILIPTKDQLGIIYENSSKNYRNMDLNENMNIELDEVGAFFKEAPVEAKLALIRDIQFLYLIQDQYELANLIKEELLKLGFTDEANRLDWQELY